MSNLKASSVASHTHTRIPSTDAPISSPLIPREDIIYHDRTKGAKIWRSTPSHAMDEDDAMVHQQLIHDTTTSSGRTNRVRVSLGDINIEIESNSSPRITHSTPRLFQRLSSSSPAPRSINGANARRATGGEIPSTPGSSPIKFKTESLSRGGDYDNLTEDVLQDEEQQKKIFHGESMDIDQQPLPDELHAEEEEDEPEPTTTTGAFGPDTQRLFGAEDDDLDDFTIPNLEITPSPEKFLKTATTATKHISSTKHSRFLTNTKEWVQSKAVRYDVPPDFIWWILERTTSRPKLAISALKSFRKHNGKPPSSTSSFLFFSFLFPFFFSFFFG